MWEIFNWRTGKTYATTDSEQLALEMVGLAIRVGIPLDYDNARIYN